MKNKLNLAFALVLTSFFSFAQISSKPFTWNKNSTIDNVVMTWNATTPEQEMQDDIKALAEHGVTIKYANMKRNGKKEITAIDVSFEDKEGNKGSLSYNQNKPIARIQFYKQGDEVGFGEPTNVFGDFAMMDDLMDDEKIIYGLDYSVNPPNGDKKITSRTMIKRDDRDPVIIEDGKVIEGGHDYSKEEIDEILKRNESDIIGNGGFKSFNYKGNQDFSEQLQHIQKQLDELKQSQEESNENAIKQSTEEIEKSKDKTEKTKSSLKIKKA